MPHLLSLGIKLAVSKKLVAFNDDKITAACSYTGQTTEIECASLVMVSSRRPHDALYTSLCEESDAWSDAGVRSVTRIGDCLAPSITADAVYAGHRYAREFDGSTEDVPFQRERVVIDSPPAFS